MNRQPLLMFVATMLLMVILVALASAQDCLLHIRCSSFEPNKHYAFLKVSFACTNCPCPSVQVAVDWSTNLVTWYPVAQAGGYPCLTNGAEVTVVDETSSNLKACRFYRARVVGPCP
jgi:hypothetical protein